MKNLAPFIWMLLVFLTPVTTLKAQCLVPESQIVSGGPGKDGIPSLTNPEALPVSLGDNFMQAQDLVLGVVVNGEARAYPHAILWWHEIVNDVLGGKPIMVSFCPLTGSGLVYDPVYPYGDYDDVNNNDVLFPQSDVDNRLPMKDTVLGVRNEGVACAYSMSVLESGESTRIIHDDINGLPVAVIYDRASAMLLGFSRVLDDPTMVEEMTLTFDLVDEGTFPFKLKDRETGSLWSLTGTALEGVLAGAQLQPLADSYSAFWFAWAAFNRDSEIYRP